MIPDGATPIRAYRSWNVIVSYKDYPSMLVRVPGPSMESPEQGDLLPLTGYGRKWEKGWNRARCGLVDAIDSFAMREGIAPYHDAPAWNCACGFNAYRQASEASWGLEGGTYGFTLVTLIPGVVEMAGRIVEHDYGYRSEYARVVGLFRPQPGMATHSPDYLMAFERAVLSAAGTYDVPILDYQKECEEHGKHWAAQEGDLHRAGGGPPPYIYPGRPGGGARNTTQHHTRASYRALKRMFRKR